VRGGRGLGCELGIVMCVSTAFQEASIDLVGPFTQQYGRDCLQQ